MRLSGSTVDRQKKGGETAEGCINLIISLILFSPFYSRNFLSRDDLLTERRSGKCPLTRRDAANRGTNSTIISADSPHLWFIFFKPLKSFASLRSIPDAPEHFFGNIEKMFPDPINAQRQKDRTSCAQLFGVHPLSSPPGCFLFSPLLVPQTN
jgi:hypothetical protein